MATVYLQLDLISIRKNKSVKFTQQITTIHTNFFLASNTTGLCLYLVIWLILAIEYYFSTNCVDSIELALS